ncbi:MAG: DNA recombination protein RmuC [Bacteroidales bacterium]|nr:DNA recombination protein RmuC [Bacteroidales bacterium]
MTLAIIILAVALIVVAAVLWLQGQKRVGELNSRLADSNATISELKKENALLHDRNTEMRVENTRLQEGMRFVQEERKRLDRQTELSFEALARKIFTENSQAFKQQHEARLAEILMPLRENLDSFRKAVNDTYQAEARERFSLKERIGELIKLNNTISQETRELTRALRSDGKAQGDWGEMVLESVLSKSGLQKGEQFETQVTRDASGRVITNDEGDRLRPDVVVHFPDGHDVVIDSKVSLSAYTDMVNADSEDDRKAAEMRHVKSVREHVKELAMKDYSAYVTGTRPADFVMMFIPSEGAYMAAMQLDNHLWQDAYDKRVLIVSPTHLISSLKVVKQLWQQEQINRNVMKIAETGGYLYDRLVGFVDAMEDIRRNIERTSKSYEEAFKKLSTGRISVLKTAENLRELGAKTSKSLPSKLIEE